MKALRHRNIVSVYEVIDDPTASKLYLIMQYIDGGAIASVSVEEGTDIVCTPIEPVQLMIYARQMLSGLEYLHRHNVVHRDIKPDNILVSKSGTVYLADFGVAETFDNHFRERMQNLLQESMMYSMAMSRAGNQPGGPQVLGKKGTLLFMAPELWENQKVYGRPIDMWALGVTLYVLLTGKLPFKNTEDIPDPNKLEVPSDYGEAWQELLLGLLEYDPERRLTVQRARSLVKEMLVALDAEVPNKVEDILQRQRTVAVSISSPAHIAEHVRAPAAPNTMPEARVTTALPAFKLKSAATCGRRPNVNVYSLLNNAS
ncbi:Protein tyrosine kinase/Protein kinase domain/Kinase-like, putative [Angomonas deanei]|uniref:Protein tyrosine kinase/Protein kinase domain/Kinase-like, putative n=1 Tax=Angomonas deanei TaxID=59799 RepID=A0A7G2CSV8_9TRYP|nr:Protein tyrosine kinase/Protein kinase domain/Kinase-like, putative [Angomonas deanei]